MAWSKKTENKMLVMTETGLALPDSAGANETSVNTSTITDDINNKKILVYVEVTETCAGDGALDCRVQASLDNSTWVNVLTTLSMDVDSTGLNKAVGKADLTDYYAPYWRIQVFSDGTDTADAAALTVKVATAG